MRAGVLVHHLLHRFGVTVKDSPRGSPDHMLEREQPDPDVEGHPLRIGRLKSAYDVDNEIHCECVEDCCSQLGLMQLKHGYQKFMPAPKHHGAWTVSWVTNDMEQSPEDGKNFEEFSPLPRKSSDKIGA